MNTSSNLRSRIAFLGVALASTGLSACVNAPTNAIDHPLAGVNPVNVPVVERQDYAFDVSAPDGMLASSEAARLDAWFRGLNLGYGDSVSVDGGAYAPSIRSDVGQIAGRYGLLMSDAAPVTPGAIAPGTVRVVVSRTRASVAGCPNWRGGTGYNFYNESMAGLGCAVNGNLAAMVANPNDLVFGREGSGVGDSITGAKAVNSYRSAKPTGEQGLQEINTQSKKGG